MRRILINIALLMCSSAAFATQISWMNEVPGTVDMGDGERFAAMKMSVNVPLEDVSRARERFESSVNIELNQFRWSGTSAAQADYFWVSAPMKYRQKRLSGHEFHLYFEPGLMTDLDSIGTESLAANVEVSGRILRSATSFWQYGIIVDRSFGDFNPRPVIAFASKLTQDTEALLGFPRSRIQTRWSNTVSTFARFYPDGGIWREEVDAVTPATTTTVAYTNWRTGVGAEFRWRSGLWLSAEIGQMRNRHIRATDASGTELRADAAENGYWQLGGSLRF